MRPIICNSLFASCVYSSSALNYSLSHLMVSIGTVFDLIVRL